MELNDDEKRYCDNDVQALMDLTEVIIRKLRALENIENLPNCHDCFHNRVLGGETASFNFCPKLGEQIRYNCPFYSM